MNGNGKELLRGVGHVPLVAPKQEMQLKHFCQDGPTAAPVVVTGLLPTPNGVQALVSFGGLTKLEALAGQIAGHLAADDSDEAGNRTMAVCAVNLAQAVLDECKRRQSPEPTQA